MAYLLWPSISIYRFSREPLNVFHRNNSVREIRFYFPYSFNDLVVVCVYLWFDTAREVLGTTFLLLLLLCRRRILSPIDFVDWTESGARECVTWPVWIAQVTHTPSRAIVLEGGGRRESCLATGCHDNGHHLFFRLRFGADAAFIKTFFFFFFLSPRRPFLKE